MCVVQDQIPIPTKCYNQAMNRYKRPNSCPLGDFLGVALVILAAGLLLAIPPIRARASYYWDEVRVKIRYAIRPPQEAVFVPQEVTALPSATPSPTPTQVATFTPTTTPQATNTPLPTATPLPASASLTGFRYINQHGLWNYCAPSNLAMALSFWGWEGDRLDTGQYLKPFEEDKNVMPYEMINYIEDMTNLSVVVRSGGTLDLLKLLIANGYPVLVEKGAMIVDYTGKLGWMGHYNYLTAYDDSAQQFLAQDSYFTPDYPVRIRHAGRRMALLSTTFSWWSIHLRTRNNSLPCWEITPIRPALNKSHWKPRTT